jgi:hypothetical protein
LSGTGQRCQQLPCRCGWRTRRCSWRRSSW